MRMLICSTVAVCLGLLVNCPDGFSQAPEADHDGWTAADDQYRYQNDQHGYQNDQYRYQDDQRGYQDDRYGYEGDRNRYPEEQYRYQEEDQSQPIRDPRMAAYPPATMSSVLMSQDASEPADEAPVIDAVDDPAPEPPAEEAPAPEAPVVDDPAPEPPADEPPAPEVPAEEAPAPEVPAEEAPAPETPAEEAPAPEAPAEEAPEPEMPAEEPLEEAPAEEPAELAPLLDEDEDVDVDVDVDDEQSESDLGEMVDLYSGCEPACDPYAPWTLPQPGVLQRLGIKMGGWVEHGITVNADDPVDRYNCTVALNDRHGEWMMNQLWLYLSKPIDATACDLQIGGHVDMFYGTDWRYAQGFGLEDRINGANDLYGFSIPQMYLELGARNLSVKMGRMAGLLGFEAPPAVANFFYSHSFATSFAEPLLVTGLMADYRLTEQWSVQAGFHRGWYMWEDVNDDVDFMAGLKWKSYDRRTSMAYAVTTGDQKNLAPFGENWFGSMFLLQHQVNDRVRYILQHDLGHADGLAGGNDAEWYGVNQYLLYTLNERWAAGLRFEWFRDDDGARVMGVGNFLGANRGWQGGPGFAGNFYEVTLGLNYKPRPNIWFRPEVRWDWYNGTTDPGGNLPYDDGQGRDQFTAAIDMIITY